MLTLLCKYWKCLFKNSIGEKDNVVRYVAKIIINVMAGRLDTRGSRTIKARHKRSAEDSPSVHNWTNYHEKGESGKMDMILE